MLRVILTLKEWLFWDNNRIFWSAQQGLMATTPSTTEWLLLLQVSCQPQSSGCYQALYSLTAQLWGKDLHWMPTDISRNSPLNSSSLWYPAWQIPITWAAQNFNLCLLTLMKLQLHFGFYLSCTEGKCFMAESWGGCWGSPHILPFSQGWHSGTACCSMLGKESLMYFD